MTWEGKVAWFLSGVSLILLSGLAFRLHTLQVERHEEFRADKRRQSSARLEIHQRRRSIFDASGRCLAVSTGKPSLFADPKGIGDPAECARRLSPILRISEEELLRKLTERHREFVWLKRKVTEEEARRAMEIAGISTVTEYQREYPEGRTACHVLGHVGLDEEGQEGVELAADAWLAERRDRVSAAVDGGRQVFRRDSAGPALRGDVVLTIDLEWQRIVEQELARSFAEHQPEAATGIVMHPRTGAILALAGLPDYDPSESARTPADRRRNRALTDPYEPGSTVKPLVIARALEKKIITPSSVFHCENGRFRVGSRTIHDHEPYGPLTVTDIVARSSNVGAVKIALLLGREEVRGILERFGFGRRAGIDLPGESAGVLYPLSRWSSFTLTSAPLGHEMLATPLQLLCAYAAVANGGRRVVPYVVEEVMEEEGTILARRGRQEGQVILSPGVAAQLKEMLRAVVVSGTGKEADVQGLRVAGKTGTTQTFDPQTRTYRRDRHIATFVGFAPVEDPQVSLIVVVHRARGTAYGGRIAAPIAARILERGRGLMGKEKLRAAVRRHLVAAAQAGRGF